MASLRVLTVDHEGRPIQFNMWLNDLQLYLLSDSRDSVSLFDHTSGDSLAPPAIGDTATRSLWITRGAAALLDIRNHLPLAECAHFGQHKTAKPLYDVIVAHYSSPAIATLGRLLLPYLFPELSAFATVEDLVTHLRTSDARYRAALPAEDHFLALDPTDLTIDLLEQHLLAAETSVVAIGAACGTPRTPFFEGCPPSPLALSYASAAAIDIPGAEDVGAASPSGKHRCRKGKGGSGGGSGGRNGGGGGSGGGGSQVGAVKRGGSGGGKRQQQQRRSETPSPQQLREWFSQRGTSGGSVSCPYVIRTGDRAGQTCGKPHTQHRCFSRLDDAWSAEFGDEAERPRWEELLRYGVAIFGLDSDAILAAMYALSVSAEGDGYLYVPPDPSIEAAALGASESDLPGNAPAEALHTFTLDSGASFCFFRDSTTLTPLSAPIPVRLADPSGGPVLARSSTVLPCVAVPSGSLSGLHLPSFSTNLVSTVALQDAMVTTTTPGGPIAPPCSCRLLWRQTLLWHHRLGHPSLPRLRGMHSRLLVVDDYLRYTTVFPLHSKGEVPHVLILWICAVCLQLRERFLQDLPFLRLHSNRGAPHWLSHGGRAYLHDPCSFPHFLWPFAVRYTAHQLNLWPRVSLPETSPTLRWTEKVGNASVFRVWGSRAFVRDTSADQLFARAIPCVFQRFPHPLPGTVPVEVAVDSGAARGAASRGAASGGAESEGAKSGGGEPRGAEPGGAEHAGPEPGGAEPEGAEPWGSESEGVESGGAEPRGTASSGGPAGASPRLSPRPEPLSPQQPREWFARQTRLRSGAAGAGDSAAGGTGAGGTRATSLGGAGVLAGAGGPGGAGAAGPGGACTRGTGAAGAGGAGGGGAGDLGAGGTRAGGAGAGDPGARGAGAVDLGAGGATCGGTGAASVGARDPGAGDIGVGGAGPEGAGAVGAGAGDTGRPRPYFVPLFQQVLGLSSSTGLTPPLLCPPPDLSQPPLEPASPLPSPSPYSEQIGGLIERREPVSGPTSPVRAVRTGRRVPPPCPPPVPSTHHMELLCATSPTVPRLLATVVTDPSFESAAASALVAELVDFAPTCRLDYATSLEDFECFAAVVPHLVSMMIAPEGDPDAPNIPTPRSYAEAITGPYSSQWQTAMDAKMASWKSTSTYVDAVPPPGANIVDGMWIFRVKRPPGSPLAFKACYVARGFSQREGVEFFPTFSPTPKMTTLWGSLHEEIGQRRSPGFTGSFPVGTKWSLRRPVYGLCQAPREWHDSLRTTLAALGFAPSTADPSLFLRTDTFLYVDNKAMIDLCQEHRLEHRMKHIALRYFLARELQQRGQLRLAYVATRANTADIFTKALVKKQE
ncbi:unnamed protein product [Closterium sp. NIES-53]